MSRSPLPLAFALTACMGNVGMLPPEPDPPLEDAGPTTPPPDSGMPPMDAGTSALDAGLDAGAPVPDAGAPVPDAGTPVPDAGMLAGKIPVFVAQGLVGRTTISCDDGRTWKGDRAWDQQGDPLMCGAVTTCICFTGTCGYMVNNTCQQINSCLDTPDVSKGLAYGNGRWVATWGWGRPGAMRTSTNGIDWVTTHGNDSFGGLVWGAGRFVAASRSPFTSADGTAWTASQTADFRNDDGTTMWSVRRLGFVDYLGVGRYIAVASGNTSRDMLVSSDEGRTWHRPATLPALCAHNGPEYGGIVSGNGIVVAVDSVGNACRSIDGGENWSVVPTGASQVLSHGVWTGTEFQFWADDKDMIHSADGVTWTKTPMVTPRRLGPVARSPGGTYVAIGNVWQGYGQQSFYRSTDGLTWTKLPAGAYAASHPLFHVQFGYADPSTECPGP